MTAGTALSFAIATPLVTAFLAVLFGSRPNLREGAAILAGIVLALTVGTLVPDVLRGDRPDLEILELVPGLTLAFRVEPLGLLFALVAAVLWPITTVYAAGYMRGHEEENQTRFFACFALAIFAAIGAAFAANLLTLFLFYELMTLTTYPLVTHHGTPKARRGGRTYLGILLSTSIAFFLLAIVWTWVSAGTLDFRDGGILAGRVEGTALAVLTGLFAFGVGKAALMPFHRWLPAAMVAPTPVSALLHAVAVVKVGVFTVLKIVVYVLGPDLLTAEGASVWLSWVAGFTMIAASVVAMTKDNLKERLAYSTIGQLAYIVLGAALANTYGLIGGGLHVATHAVGKITLFFCAGAIYVAAHETEISRMQGLGRRMPVTMTAFAVAAISVIGLPPCGGAWSKWFLALGAADGARWWLLAALMASSLLNIAYLMPIPIRAFFAPPLAADAAHGDGAHDDHGGMHEAPWPCVAALTVTALGTIALFFTAPWIVDLLRAIPALGGPR